MDLNLAGKTALITGGSKGIGLAVARLLALKSVMQMLDEEAGEALGPLGSLTMMIQLCDDRS